MSGLLFWYGVSRCDTSATTSWMKSFVFADYTLSLQPMFPPKHFDTPPGCSEGLYGRLFTTRGFLRQTTTQGLLDPTRPISLTLTLTQIPLPQLTAWSNHNPRPTRPNPTNIATVTLTQTPLPQLITWSQFWRLVVVPCGLVFLAILVGLGRVGLGLWFYYLNPIPNKTKHTFFCAAWTIVGVSPAHWNVSDTSSHWWELGSNERLRTKCQTEIQGQREGAAQRAVFFLVGQPHVT